MSEYPKFIGNRYWVWAGTYQYDPTVTFNSAEVLKEAKIDWEFKRAFRFKQDAEAYAQGVAGYYQAVKIEKREPAP